MKIFKNFLQLFYPSVCPSCSILVCRDEIYCSDCFEQIKPIVSSFLPLTPKHSIKVFSVSDYKEPLRKLILRKSFSDVCASKQLAQVILKRIDLKRLNIDFIVPVPLHWTRFAKRGFNQADVMAKVLSKQLDVPVLSLLKRKKRTQFQSSLPVEQRAENLKNAFDLSWRFKNNQKLSYPSTLLRTSAIKYLFDKIYLEFNLKDKNILLVDDLCTTGATLQNSAKILLPFRPQAIFAVVACRVV